MSLKKLVYMGLKYNFFVMAIPSTRNLRSALASRLEVSSTAGANGPSQPPIMGDAQSQLGQGPETRRDVMGQWDKTKHMLPIFI